MEVFNKEDYEITIFNISNSQQLTDSNILLTLTILKDYVFNEILHIIMDSQFVYNIINMDLTNNDQSNIKKKALFKSYFETNDILIIPLFYHNHWSLCIYIKNENTLLHFDSISKRHNTYIIKFIKRTKELNIHIKHYKKIPTINQDGIWECGYYILMYYYIFMLCNNSIGKVIEKIQMNQIKQFILSIKNLLTFHYCTKYKNIYNNISPNIERFNIIHI